MLVADSSRSEPRSGERLSAVCVWCRPRQKRSLRSYKRAAPHANKAGSRLEDAGHPSDTEARAERASVSERVSGLVLRSFCCLGVCLLMVSWSLD